MADAIDYTGGSYEENPNAGNDWKHKVIDEVLAAIKTYRANCKTTGVPDFK